MNFVNLPSVSESISVQGANFNNPTHFMQILLQGSSMVLGGFYNLILTQL